MGVSDLALPYNNTLLILTDNTPCDEFQSRCSPKHGGHTQRKWWRWKDLVETFPWTHRSTFFFITLSPFSGMSTSLEIRLRGVGVVSDVLHGSILLRAWHAPPPWIVLHKVHGPSSLPRPPVIAKRFRQCYRSDVPGWGVDDPLKVM